MGRLRVSAFLVFLFLNLIACQKKEVVEVLRLAQTENLYSLDPDRAADAQSRAILSNIYEALVEFDSELKIRPALAVNWNAPDELTWIFELRRNVKFHDGNILTASDVKASFERVGGPGIQDPVLGISRIDVIDASHVRLKLVHPSPLLLNRLTQILIVPLTQAGVSITHPIGTGPYRFVDWKNNELKLEAYDSYWRGKPSIQRVIFSSLPANEIAGHFSEKKLDVYRLLPGSIAEKAQDGFRVVGRSGLSEQYLWFNCAPVVKRQKNPFSAIRVRQAISLALDRNRIVNRLGGREARSDQLIPEGVFGFMPEWGKLSHDAEHSRKLLRESGYVNGFETTLTHPQGEAYHRLAATIVEMLAPVGIRVQPKELEFSEFLEARRNQELPFYALTWTFDDGDAWTFLMASLHTKAGAQDFRSTNPGYSNHIVDQLIEESQLAPNVEDISRPYEAILKIAISELPLIPLYTRYDRYGVSDRVRFQPRLDGKLLAAEMKLKE